MWDYYSGCITTRDTGTENESYYNRALPDRQRPKNPMDAGHDFEQCAITYSLTALKCVSYIEAATDAKYMQPAKHTFLETAPSRLPGHCAILSLAVLIPWSLQ